MIRQSPSQRNWPGDFPLKRDDAGYARELLRKQGLPVFRHVVTQAGDDKDSWCRRGYVDLSVDQADRSLRVWTSRVSPA